MKHGNISITFLGSGDAFGSGGRLQPCVHVDTGAWPFLLDCGASSLTAMRRFGINPNDIDTILVSHLHGDHFSGIPFLLRETQILADRSKSLTIAGPPGLEDAVRACMSIFFPGSWSRELDFGLAFIEMEAFRTYPFGSVGVTLFPAVHSYATRPHSIRVDFGLKALAYSGDTRWNTHLIDACESTDLLICECFKFEGPLENHLDYQTLRMNRHLLNTRRIVLTHMSHEMLGRIHEVEFECSYDGMTIEI